MLRPHHILLVEDSEDDVALVKRALRKSAIANTLVHVPDGVKALDYLRDRQLHAAADPSVLPVLVLLDVHLPGLDGFQVVRALREDDQLDALPIAMFLSADNHRERDAAEQLAVAGITKPLDFHGLATAARHFGLHWTTIDQPQLATGSDPALPLAKLQSLALCRRR